MGTNEQSIKLIEKNMQVGGYNYTTTLSGDESQTCMDSGKNEQLKTNGSYDFQVPEFFHTHAFSEKEKCQTA